MEKSRKQPDVLTIAVTILSIAVGIIVATIFFIQSENSARDRELQSKFEHLILHNGGYTIDKEGNLIKE